MYALNVFFKQKHAGMYEVNIFKGRRMSPFCFIDFYIIYYINNTKALTNEGKTYKMESEKIYQEKRRFQCL